MVDLGGDVRANPKLSGTKHNVFGIQTGVAISFLVKREQAPGRCRIFYARRPELETAEEKLAFLGSGRLAEVSFEEVTPDATGNWINLANTDFESFIPLVAPSATSSRRGYSSIVEVHASGIKTNRDAWLYDLAESSLRAKVDFFVKNLLLQRNVSGGIGYDGSIKWSRDLKVKHARGLTEADLSGEVVPSLWRPYVKRLFFVNNRLADILTQQHAALFGPDLRRPNVAFAFSVGRRGRPSLLATNLPSNYDLFIPDVAQLACAYRYTRQGDRIDNVSDWAAERFETHYGLGSSRPITKEAIFHYVYAVLHDPLYREKYALNLRRELPRIPFYADFWRWAEWGRELMELHIGYESVSPWPLARTDVPDERARRAGLAPKTMLKADKAGGRIVLDGETTLAGVPPEAWEYRIANRSAIEWVLDQYKEKKPRDPTIREHFDSYRFEDSKEEVVELLGRVAAVSVRTVRIVGEMRSAKR